MGWAPRYVRWRDPWLGGSKALLRWLCTWCAVLVLCARAQALDLTWSAPAGCPGKAEIQQRVAALHARHGRVDPGGSADAQIERENSGEYRLTLKLSVGGESMARVVRSADCQTAGETAAWLLAMAGAREEPPAVVPAVVPSVAPKPRANKPPASSAAASSSSPAEAHAADAPRSRPQAAARERPGPARDQPKRAPERTPEPAAEREREVEAEAPRVARPRRPLGPRWGRSALFAGVWGSGLPGASTQLGLRVGLGRGILYGELRGAFVLPREQREGELGKVRVATQQLGLSGCTQWGDRWRGGPCLQLTGQRSVGTTTIGVGRREDDVFWLTAGPAAMLGVRLYGPLELSVEAGIGLPLSARPRFSVEGRGPVASAGFVSGHAQIGLGVRWQ